MDTPKEIPSARDWGDVTSDQDVRYAHEKFFGKNLDEALIRFEDRILAACEDLRFMPAIPFRYYMLAFKITWKDSEVWRTIRLATQQVAFFASSWIR